ncbi:hypothetical protein BDN72DRAFT_93790 [Pluteus cervinus]|uniref:Uncharacterized protein n=1 Tax=Pluteus cervinus TaxID=181527 RepID=A0ACD3APB4_9AGAR|nr:hypothetical protein BDN72DRAFT_93790 [Pluteus cervinus]
MKRVDVATRSALGSFVFLTNVMGSCPSPSASVSSHMFLRRKPVPSDMVSLWITPSCPIHTTQFYLFTCSLLGSTCSGSSAFPLLLDSLVSPSIVSLVGILFSLSWAYTVQCIAVSIGTLCCQILIRSSVFIPLKPSLQLRKCGKLVALRLIRVIDYRVSCHNTTT